MKNIWAKKIFAEKVMSEPAVPQNVKEAYLLMAKNYKKFNFELFS